MLSKVNNTNWLLGTNNIIKYVKYIKKSNINYSFELIQDNLDDYLLIKSDNQILFFNYKTNSFNNKIKKVRLKILGKYFLLEIWRRGSGMLSCQSSSKNIPTHNAPCRFRLMVRVCWRFWCCSSVTEIMTKFSFSRTPCMASRQLPSPVDWIMSALSPAVSQAWCQR